LCTAARGIGDPEFGVEFRRDLKRRLACGDGTE